jgi:hypothetical protein
MKALWDKFWFEPTSPASLALFRIGFGFIVVLVLSIPIGHSFSDWLGPHGLFQFDLVQKIVWRNWPRYDCFQLLGDNEALANLYFLSIVLAAFSVCIGFLTQFSTAYLALGLISLDNHVALILPEGSDTLLRLCAIFLAFSPAGEMYSVDALIKGADQSKGEILGSPWAQRMIQLQLCFAYGETGLTKMFVPGWWDGSYLYYASHLQELIHLPAFGFFDNIWMLRVSSWLTILAEFSMVFLVWIRPIRYLVLIGLIVFHLFVDLFINLPIFEYVFIWTLVVFVYPQDVESFISSSKKLLVRLRVARV